MIEWRPVVGWEERYEVSNTGRVRTAARVIESKNRWGPYKHFRPARELARSVFPNGYFYLTLMGADKLKQSRPVHSLVLEAFVGPRPSGMVACHGPTGKRDNHWPENLSWGTVDKNQNDDRLRDGTHPRNMGPRSTTTSRFKGVSWNKRRQKWSSQIHIGGKYRHLGLFDEEKLAAQAYDQAAIAAWGTDVYLNSQQATWSA